MDDRKGTATSDEGLERQDRLGETAVRSGQKSRFESHVATARNLEVQLPDNTVLPVWSDKDNKYICSRFVKNIKNLTECSLLKEREEVTIHKSPNSTSPIKCFWSSISHFELSQQRLNDGSHSERGITSAESVPAAAIEHQRGLPVCHTTPRSHKMFKSNNGYSLNPLLSARDLIDLNVCRAHSVSHFFFKYFVLNMTQHFHCWVGREETGTTVLQMSNLV